MRLPVAVAVVLLSLSGWAQQNKPFKVKSRPEKAPKQGGHVGKIAPSKAVSANAKELKTAEHQNAKLASSSRTQKRGGKKATGLKPVKEKNPPINFAGGAGRKKTGTTTTKGSNPYQGRLKQKGKKGQ